MVYASKLFEIVQDHLPNAHCFADDTQLYLSFDPNSPTDQAMALEAMERCISDLRKWMYRDKLKINDDKTELISCYRIETTVAENSSLFCPCWHYR